MSVAMIGPKFYAWDKNGKPLAFGKLYTYQARTNVPKDTYQSEDQIVANANPVILNGEGYANVYLDGSYKVVLKDSDENEIWSADPVSASEAKEWINCQSATYISSTSLSVAGNFVDVYSAGVRVRVDNNTPEYSYDSVKSSTYAGGITTITLNNSVVTTGVIGICSALSSQKSSSILAFGTLGEALNSKDLSSGQTVVTRGRDTEFDSGAGAYDTVLTADVTPDGKKIIQCVGVPSISLKVREFPGAYSDQAGLGGPIISNTLSLIGNLRYSAILTGRNNIIDMGAGAVGLGDGALICGGNDNRITALFDGDCQGAFIGGGWQNRADGYWVTIAGGKGNEINADIVNYSFIGGGNTNLINGTQAFLSVICGGRDNVISGDTANRCFIGGGGENTITGAATSRAVLVGGELNQITGDNAFYTFLGGGQSNQITGQNSGHSVLIGGKSNQIIGSNTVYAFIGGGESNNISASTGQHSVIVGGRENNIQNNAQYSVIAGGFQNLMNGQRSFIGSGFANNIATASGTQNVIVGGNQNKMLSTTIQNSFIGGGFDNEIGVAASGTVLVGVSILGGEDNIAIASRASMLGGLGLRADSYLEVVKGTYNDPANPDGIGSPSKTAYIAEQTAEALGIGTSDVARANAYVWLKNGKQIRYFTPVYADNAAALAGSELVGTVYRTATGELKEVY